MNSALFGVFPAPAITGRQLGNLARAALACADQLETVAAQGIFDESLCVTIERMARDVHQAAREVESLLVLSRKPGSRPPKKSIKPRALPVHNDPPTLHATPAQDQQCSEEVKGPKKNSKSSRRRFRET
jgi:hypothetical protein